VRRNIVVGTDIKGSLEGLLYTYCPLPWRQWEWLTSQTAWLLACGYPLGNAKEQLCGLGC